jgi:NADPH:quinone reductase-like Zn-dependent oxidoreductase
MATKYKQLKVQKLGTNFRDIIEIVEAELPADLKEDHVILKTAYVALNASDINLSNGNYGLQAPFIGGFEALGEVVKIGCGVTNLQVGGFAYYFSK